MNDCSDTAVQLKSNAKILVKNGIELVPLTYLPDKLKRVFPFKYFNAVQSRCFDLFYRSEENVVISSPTGKLFPNI